MKTLSFLLLTGLLSTSAEARFCEDPNLLSKKTEDCGDNGNFSEAAVLCLERFEKAIADSRSAVKSSAAALSNKSKSNQADKQKNAILDYQLSKATLDTLIAQGKAAQAETAQYFDGVVWPEDFDEPEITGDNLDEFLNSESCYKDTRDLIGNVLEDFDNYLSQLSAAKDAGSNLENASSGHESKMESLGEGEVKNLAPKPGKLPGFKGQTNRPESDISGTKDAPKQK